MKIFIDTNVFLTFYHFSSDDLEELRKLAVILDDKRHTLYVTDQVLDELKRNREAKIADALNRFQAQKLEDQFPQMCKEYPEYQQMRNAMRVFYENKEVLRGKLVEDVESGTLKADSIIQELLGMAQRYPTSEELVSKARLRIELGNPPGKKGSLGDAINWETLLEEVPTQEDLYFVSGDKDYMSPMTKTGEDSLFSEYLSAEWREKKESKIFFYPRLSKFLGEQFPAIKLASELEKILAIRSLVESGSFDMTHSAITRASRIENFTPTEVDEIADAIVSNSQISWIVSDTDVNRFIVNLLKNYGNVMNTAKKEELELLLERAEAAEDRDDESDLAF